MPSSKPSTDPRSSKRSVPLAGSSGGMSEGSSVLARLPHPVAVPATMTFEDFFDTESPVLFRRLCLLTRDRTEAEDVMQDTFLRLWERWDRVSAMEDPTGYLYRTAMNGFRSRRRRVARTARLALQRDRSIDPYETADTRDAVLRTLDTLGRRQRSAVVLTDYRSGDEGTAPTRPRSGSPTRRRSG